VSRATTRAAPRRYHVVEGWCLDCAGDVAGTLRRLAGVRDVQVLPAAELLVIDGDPDDGAVTEAAATLGIRLIPQTAETPTGPAAAGPWWRQPQMLALLGAAGLWLAGFAVERLTRVEPLVAGLYWATLLVGGWYPARSAWRALRSRRLTISTLLVVAAAGAVTLGVVGEAALLVVVFSLGEVLEEYATGKARGAVRALMALAPDRAHRRRPDKGLETVPADQLVPGDVVVVRPGERVPTDGRVVAGYSTLDQSPVTGESLPVEATEGSEVFAGSICGIGALEVEVGKPYQDTTLARVIRQVQQAQAAQGPAQRFADRFGAVYTPAMFALAVAVAALPALAGADAREWAYRALVVLVVSCSCALVISVPTAVVAAITRAARDGILVKGGVHLEALGRVQAIALDKTGTLTAGRAVLTDVAAAPGHDDTEEVLGLAAAVEAASEHPLADAIVRGARNRNIHVTPATDLRATPGVGVEATVGGRRLFVGRATNGSGWAADRVAAFEAQGRTAVVLAEDGTALGVLAVADELRPEARAVGDRLRRLGIEHLVVLTGDNDRVAAAIARQAGMDDWYAGLLPEDKTAAITRLRQRYGSIAMVGDGVNDAPALASSDVGVAMGAAGTDVALETADVALMADDLRKLPEAIAHGRRTHANLRQNIALSLIVVAGLVTAALTGRLSLTAGLLLNEATALAVIANGLRLLRPTGRRKQDQMPDPKERDDVNQRNEPGHGAACSSQAAEVLEQAARLRRLADQALIDSQRTSSGAQLRLRHSPEVEAGVREFIQWEASCCPFLDFSVDTGNSEIRIDVHAPGDAGAILDLLVAVTSTPSS
jgi:Zn2+/Cd2+-exporting ATPase